MASFENPKLFQEVAVWDDRLSYELESAREIRNRLMRCNIPEIPDLDCYGECRQAGDAGGDFFDFTSGPGPAAAAWLGSALQHGIASATVMTALQATIRAMPAASADSVAVSVIGFNRLVCALAPDEFCAALFAAKIDVRRGRLDYVNAGPVSAMIFRYRTGRAVALDADSPVLGLSQRSAYRQHHTQFQPGDTLVACTQAAVEEMVMAVRANGAAGATELADSVLDMGDAVECDEDRSVVVVRFLGPSITVAIDEAAYAVPAMA